MSGIVVTCGCVLFHFSDTEMWMEFILDFWRENVSQMASDRSVFPTIESSAPGTRPDS